MINWNNIFTYSKLILLTTQQASKLKEEFLG